MTGETVRLTGWGGGPGRPAQVHRPASLAAARDVVGALTGWVPRGAGRSYGDAAVASHVVLGERVDIALDPSADRAVCGAGVRLGDLLARIAPLGRWLPVVPGTAHVTIGGCAAADVHGKNHVAAGAFGRHVERLRLIVASGALVDCDRGRHPDLFAATLGGFGLTGLIVEVTLRLERVPSTWQRVRVRRTRSVLETLDTLEAGLERLPYGVAWLDLGARGRGRGAGVVRLSDWVERPGRAPRYESPWAPVVPRGLPGGLLNGRSLALFNAVYGRTGRDGVVDVAGAFFPLDRLRSWSHLYGPAGLMQHQSVLPAASARRGLTRMLACLATGPPCFLAVLKRLGGSEPGPLSFPIDGPTLALDFAAGPAAHALFERLDRVVLEHGGRVYLAKDASLDATRFARMYGDRLAAFRRLRERWDPQARIRSALAERIGLAGPERYDS